MKEIKVLKTTQIMLFPVDDIDINSLRRNESILLLKKEFKLHLIQAPDNLPFLPLNIVFRNGEFIYENKIYIIEELVIEERKIIIKIFSSSDIAKKFFKALKTILISIDNREAKGRYIPLITTFETLCIVKLDFNISKLIQNSPLETFYSNLQNSIDTYNSDVTIIPYSFRFKIKYDNIPAKLKKSNITIADKHIIIEVRDNTDPSEQIYFTSSPNETEIHLKLLETLERLVLKNIN